MKIYFTASLTGKKLYEENYRRIVSCLKDLNCKVFAEHVFRGSGEGIRKENRKERMVYHRLLNRNIKWCDVAIAEVSYPSTSVGYEISLVLKKGKPVIALYSEKEGDYPPILQALREEKAMLVSYSLGNLKDILQDNISFIKTKALEKRFTMLLSPKITDFLSKISRQEKIPRSEYIRDLIRKDMKKRKF